MPDWIKLPRYLVALVGAAAALIFPAAAFSAAAVDTRIIGIDLGLNRAAPAGVVAGPPQELASHTQYTGTVRIKTDPKATCFGFGTGGSGERVKIAGPTALGAVRDALRADRDLRPLSVTDAFDFGLGLCGIGGFEAPSTGFWYLKLNHAGAQVGGDQLKVRTGDQVLWHLVPDFTAPLPAELEIEADPIVSPGSSVQVTVYQYADDGSRSPAAGVSLDTNVGAQASGTLVTDASGSASVAAGPEGRLVLGASRGLDIPAAEIRICVSDDAESCSDVLGKQIFGSNRAERIKGTSGDDLIKPFGDRDRVNARGGDDIVKARGGGRDWINCGSGDDLVKVSPNDKPMKNCERIRVA